MKIIIDATNATLGRLASYAAKQALLGKEVIIINSEKAIITGKKKDILGKYLDRRKKHGASLKGPIFPKTSERILKRAIRGMLPKNIRGMLALKKVKCYKAGMNVEKEKIIKAGKAKKRKIVKIEDIENEIR